MGGVGKTTLATEVAASVKDFFADVVFVTVKQKVDEVDTKIQKVVENAAKRIKKGEKVLIIVDDVWTKLELPGMGIPCLTAFPSCKILLTSRQRSVCTVMEANTIIYVQPLPIEEALAFFKRVVGENCDNLKVLKVVKEIVQACGGLPLLLKSAGKALKNEKNIKEWKNARDSIKKYLTLPIDPSITSEFSLLRLSYDRLKCEEAKSIFLLCCVLPEYHVSLEKLAHYRVGFQLFFEKKLNRLASLKDARVKVQIAVEILKSSCLLLDGEYESTIKIHDVVRRVGLLIASDDKKEFWVEAGENLIQGEISDKFFRAPNDVQVIDFEFNDISYLPETLKQHKKLRMLNLYRNKLLCDISKLGEQEGLEILILSETGITKIPQEIGTLHLLRVFLAERCPALSRIERGVLAKLRWLEELSIGCYQVEDGEYNSLVEIGELPLLTSLNLWVKRICLIPEVDYLKGLERFCIQFGAEEDWSDYDIPGDKTLILDTLDYADIINSHSHVTKLMEVCNFIALRNIKNLDKKIPMMYCTGEFSLKAIEIVGCDNLLYLVDSSVLDKMLTFHLSKKRRFLAEVEQITLTDSECLKGIWNCADKYISFNNLVTLYIMNCPKLEKLFSVSVLAEGLVNLEELTIKYCGSLKEVISDGEGETSTSEIEMVVPTKPIVFRHLAKILISSMGSLASFYHGNATIEYHSLVEVVIWHCNEMKSWGNETHDTPKVQFVKINGTKANGSTMNEALAKYKEAEELRVKQRHDQRTEEGPSSVGEE